MKKKYIIISIVICLTAICIVGRNQIYKWYKVHQIERDMVDFLNMKPNDRIAKEGLDELEYLFGDLDKRNKEANNHDVTNLINQYFKEATKSVELINEYGNFDETLRIKMEEWKDKTFSLGIGVGVEDQSYCELAFLYGASEIKEEDVEKYRNGIFKEDLIEKVKKIIEYEMGEDGTIKWYIRDTKAKNIELPYGFYIEYSPELAAVNKDVDKVISCKIRGEINFDEHMSATVTSLMKNGEKKEDYLFVEVSEYDKNKRYIDLLGIYSEPRYSSGKKIYLTQHEGEKRREASNRMY